MGRVELGRSWRRLVRRALHESAMTFGLTVTAACAHSGVQPGVEVPDPDASIVATLDPIVIGRGRYLAYGPAHCVACHTPEGPLFKFALGQEPPLIGGYELHFTGGRVAMPNLTPDTLTGIGRRTDLELVRMLRHSRRPDGSKALPIMEYPDLSDDDLLALISFLRAQPPIHHAVPDRKLNVLGSIGMALFVRAMEPSDAPPARSPAAAATVERGAYLVNVVAGCASCHTKRSGTTGAYKGPRLAGGWKMELEGDPQHEVVTPNLTPDPRTGAITDWTEERFVARFREGPRVPGSHMPWRAYATMTNADLRAMYRYLRTLSPVENDTRPTLRRREPPE